MLCFRLPKWVIRRLDKVRRSFLWGKSGNNTKQGISLINWPTVTIPKKWGGLGVSDLELTNMALLIRWWWKLYREEECLWTSMVQQIRRRNPSRQGPKFWTRLGSFFWHQLQNLKSLFLWSTSWQIGDGNHISFWCDNWHSGVPLPHQNTAPEQPFISLREATLDQVLLQSDHVQEPISLTENPDLILWRWESSGLYTAKSAYRAFFQGDFVEWPYQIIWQSKATPTAKIFAYLMLNGKILTRDNLRKRGMNFGMHCVLCMNCPSESILHALFLCPFAVAVWFHIAATTGQPLMKPAGSVTAIWDSSWAMVKDGGYLSRRDWTTGFICTVWMIWKQRNAVIFREERLQPIVVALRCVHELKLWRKFG